MMDRRTVAAIAAETFPRGVWLAAVDALGEHETGCIDCWRRRTPRCAEGRRLLKEEEAAYRMLLAVREAGLDGAP